jgi:uncharacterized protein YuzE
MKPHYHPETDSLYIELRSTPGAETREVAPGLDIDLDADADGDVVGFDIDCASRRFDLTTLETTPVDAAADRVRPPVDAVADRVRPRSASAATAATKAA